MKNSVVTTKNISGLIEASTALLTRTPGTPGMGLIFGKSGFGKTTATAWFVNQRDGVYVRALSTWTPTSMLQAILKELDLSPVRMRSAEMVNQIADTLRVSGRPIFIDEFDYIIEDKKMTETLRDIHDISSVPIVLIGMENSRRKVQLREQFVNRIAQFVEFKPTDYDDCKRLATELCEVSIADDLLRKMLVESKGVIRLIVTGLDAIERRAKTLGVKEISQAQWGKEGFFLSESHKNRGN